MTRSIRHLVLFTAIGLSFAACDKKESDEAVDKAAAAAKKGVAAANKAADKVVDKAGGAVAAAANLAAASQILAHVPSDTPYVFAMLEPVPDAVIDKIFVAMEPFAKKAEAEIAKELARAKADDSQKGKLQAAILEEITGNINKDGFTKFGFGKFPQMTIYGVGLLPAFRIQLEDPKKLKDMIARVETKAGMKAPTKKMGEVEYWGIDEDGMSVAIAIIGDELVFGMAPEAAAATVLPYVLGTKKPAKSLADSGELTKIATANGFTGHGIGMIDLTNIFDTILGDGAGLNAEVWKGVGSPLPPQTAECKTEYKAMAGNFPRMVFGYTEFSTTQFRAKYIVESKAKWAKDLGGLAAPVPGLKLEGTGLFSFGVGLDLQKSVDFAKAIVADIKANPYKCAHLSEVNENIAQVEMGLGQPIPPALAGIKGFNVVVESGDFSGPQPKNIKAIAVIAADKPLELFSMAQGMAPPLAQLKLTDDGKPVALPAGLVPPVVDSPHVAMNKSAIAFSVGVGQEAKLGAALSAGVGTMKPLMAISYDIKQFMDIMAKSGTLGSDEAQLMSALGGLMGRTSYALYTGEQGIIFEQLVTLP